MYGIHDLNIINEIRTVIHDNRNNVLFIILFQIEIDNDEILKEIEEEKQRS